jgi:tripartite-type tricarboxylate transporter receptor subunit TctC
MQKAGIPGYDFVSWNAVWVPARTPPAVVARLNCEIVAIGESEEAKRFTATLGITSTASTPEWLAEFNRRKLPQWAQIVGEAGIQKE